MFLPHFSAAFAGKRIAPRPSLGWFVAACQLPDLVWPFFVLAGWERVAIAPGNTAYTPLAFEHYPWTHSLLMVAVWGIALGALYGLRARDGRGAVVLALVVVSHWVLDWISHGPDLPLVPWSDVTYGLGLWRSVPATLAVEVGLFAAALAWYVRGTAARDRVGRVGLWALAAILLLAFAGAALGPPPPNATTVAASALFIWLLIPLSAWIDKHRVSGGT